MIRQANLNDISKLLVLCEKYVERSGHKTPFDEETSSLTFRYMIEGSTGQIFVNDDVTAAMGLFIAPFTFNAREKFCQCMFIWSDVPGDGRRLMRWGENWAKNNGSKYMHINALESQYRVAKFYQRAGYEPLEHTFVKEL